MMRESSIRLYDRKPIFSKYQIPDMGQDKNKESYLQANSKAIQQIQILLKKSSLMNSNISQVLEIEEELIKKLKISQDQLKEINKILVMINLNYTDNQGQINQLCNKYFISQGSQIRPTNVMDKYFQLLIYFNNSLKKAQYLKYQIQSFRLGNLSNFNPNHTKPVFTKNSYTAKKILRQYLNALSDCRFRLMEASVRNMSNDESNRFLLDQQYYEQCLSQLQDLVSIKKQEQVHFLMLNVLDQFDKQAQEYKQFAQSSSNNFKQHQAVYDSYNLMGQQINIMKESQKDWNGMVDTLIRKQKGDMNIEDEQKNNFINSEEVNSKNLSIFQLNQKLFSRINTQTNLQQYSSRRNQYSTNLKKYQKNYKSWNQQRGLFQQIQRKNSEFNEIKRQCQIKDSGMINKKKQEELLKLRHKVSVISINNNAQAYQYKKSVVDSMTTYLKSKNIYIDQRTELNDLKDSQDIKKFQKFKNFFLEIDNCKDKNKKIFLRSKSEDVKALLFEATLQLSHPQSLKIKKEYEKYKIALQYCEAINQKEPVLTLQDLYQKSQNVWRPLPAQFQYYFSQNFHDCFLMKSLKKSKQWNKFQQSLKQYYKTNMQNEANYSAIQEAPYRNFQKWNYNILGIYECYLHKVSSLSQSQFKSQQNIIWNRIAATERQCEKKGSINSNIGSKASMDKKKFYQFRNLSFISERECALSFYVQNLPGLVLYIVKHINSEFIDMTPKSKYLQIIKLTMMGQYLKHIQKTTNSKAELQIIEKLRSVCILSLLIQEYLLAYTQNDSQHINYLIRLHKMLLSFQKKFKSTQKLQLQEVTAKCIKEIIDSSIPLVFALKKTKVINFQDVQNLYSIKNWLLEWKQCKIDIIADQQNQKALDFLCDTYIKLIKIDNLMKFSELEWQQFQNMLVRKRRNECYKFRTQIQQVLKLKGSDQCQQRMISIMKLYKQEEKAPLLAKRILDEMQKLTYVLKKEKNYIS